MILERIVADKNIELVEQKRARPLAVVQEAARQQPLPRDFAAALRGDGVRLIAEVKKASPSKGVIRHEFDPVAIAGIYAANGAAAVSVLTEKNYFQGSLDYLKDIRAALGDKCPPLLRKDFLTESYQLYEARAYGADAVLLITAILDAEKLAGMLRLAGELGMACLVEVHDEAEMAVALGAGAEIIGVNNRNLKDFSVDLATTARLRQLVPSGKTVVSESGISSREEISRLRDMGVDAVLVGEALMAAPDIAEAMKKLL